MDYTTRITREDGTWIEYFSSAENAKAHRAKAIQYAKKKHGITKGTAKVVGINSTTYAKGRAVKFDLNKRRGGLKSWFWLVSVSPSQDLFKWGKGGGLERPKDTFADAEKEYQYLRQTDTHKEDRFYVLEVFSNGCMVTHEPE